MIRLMSVMWAALMLTSFTADLAEAEDQPANLQQTLGGLD